MGARRQLPDIMGEALGRLGISPAPAPAPPSPPARPVLVPLVASEFRPFDDLADRLGGLGLKGMAQALRESGPAAPEGQQAFLDGLETMLAREEELRRERGLESRLRRARLPQAASLEDLEEPEARGLDPGFLARLAEGHWLADRRNLLLWGAVGAGKTYLACALARRVCLGGETALYARVPQALAALAEARAQGRWSRSMAALARPRLLVLDDWGLAPLTPEQNADLLELAQARHGRGSTLIASALTEEEWPRLLPPGLTTQALLDRWTPGALRIVLKGGSRRG